MLCCNLSIQLAGNIQLVQSVVSSETVAAAGTVNMTFYPNMPGNSTLRPEEKMQLQSGITPAK
jgi:hypothetical protein